MNDLQLALLALGGSAIVAMLLWNWFVDYRAQKQNKQRFDNPTDDPLLPTDQRTEPGMYADPSEAAGMSMQAQFDSHMMAPATVSDADLPNGGLAPDTPEKIHSFIYISFETPQSMEFLSEQLHHLSRIGTKSIKIACLQAQDNDDRWYVPSACQQVSAIRFAVPLANRKGPITAIEYSEFFNKAQRFAEQYAGELESPDLVSVIAKAEKLDQQAASLDVSLGLHCVLPAQASNQDLQGMLQEAGWVSAGRLWWLFQGENQLASVVIHDTPGKRVLSFTLDLPNTNQPLFAIDSICALGDHIANVYQGALMDDAGRPVTEQALIGIRQQLESRIRALNEAGFSPGSLTSRLLFS